MNYGKSHIHCLRRPTSLISHHATALLCFLTISFLLGQSSQAAITYRSSSSASQISFVAGGMAVNVPAGTALNDVMIASIAYRPCSNTNGGACTTTITPPAGWTLIRGTNTTNGGGTGGFGSRLLVYSRVATATEPASFTWLFGGAPTHSGATAGILSFSGVDTTNPIVAEAGQTTPNSYNHSTPSINTGTVTNTMLVSSHSVNSSGTWTPPAGMTERVDIASRPTPDALGIMLEMNHQTWAASGATGTRTAIQSNPPASDTGGTHILALRPAPACSDPDPSTITIPVSQTASGDPFDASGMFTSTGDVGSFEYKVTSGSGVGTVNLLDNGGASWSVHTEGTAPPTTHTYTAPAGNNRVVIAVISGEGPAPTITSVTIGGSAATLIRTVTNGNSTIWTYYRPIGSSASTTAANIAVNWGNTPNTDAAINAATYSGVIQAVGTGAAFAINSTAIGTAASGTTTTSTTVTNVTGGRVIYAINMNRGNADNQVSTATSAAWTFNETWDVYVTSNRTAAGHSNTAAGSATVSVGTTVNHNRSSLVAFALNPAPAVTVCTDWTSTSSIPASIANGSSCDFTDGGTYTLDVRGVDPDCSVSVTTTATNFTWLNVDTTPPTISNVSGSCSTNQVSVFFSEDVDQTTAETSSNYALDNGATIISASRTATNTVTLTTSALIDLTTYTLTVNNVEDLLGNVILPASTSIFSLNCSNLIAYYQLDEASWNGTANEVVDQSGNSLHGTAVGGVTTSEAKVCNGAILDGITLAYVEVADDPLLDIPDELTVSLWIKTNVIPPSGLKTILSKDQNYEFHINSAGRIYWWWNDAGGAAHTLTSATTVSVGTWHHIAIVYSKSASSQTIYIDGVADVNTSNRNESLYLDTDPLQIGGDQAFATREFDGLIDEVRIYESALTQTQIQADMNVTRPCTTPVTCSFRDNFTTVSYSNDDGTLSWTGDWLETNDNNAPASGDAYIAGGDLILHNQTGTGGSRPVLSRELDLTGATSATLEFTFSTTAGVDTNDRFQVEVSADGGGSWNPLETIDNINGATTLSRSYPIDAYMSNNTQIRLQISGGYTGANEEVHFYYVAVLPGGVCGVPSADHYTISHSGTGITCEAEPVTISAHDPLHLPVAPLTTITISTAPNADSWALQTGTPANFTDLGGGQAEYTFAAGESSVVFWLTRLTAAVIDIDVVDSSGINETTGTATGAEDPTIDFRDTGFRFYANGTVNSIGTQIAGKESNIGPGSQTLTVRAIQTNTDTMACEARLLGNQSIGMAFECVDPTTCQTADGVDITGIDTGGAAIGTTAIADNPLTVVSSYTNVTLEFDATGTATFTMNYADVGQIALHAQTTIAALAPDPAITLTGTSNTFTVRPFGFLVTAAGNLGAVDSDGAIFTQAGADFTVDVTAVAWQAADDLNSDGIPDGHNDADPSNNADLSDNSTTPNFGLETTPETVTLTAFLDQPGGGNDPGLTGTTLINTFAAGSGSTIAARYDEVGIIEITAAITDGDYLGIGAATTSNIASKSGYVGRFIPANFTLAVANNGSFANTGTNTTFTYLGELFGYDAVGGDQPKFTITAVNVAGNTTQNYTGGFNKIDLGEITLTYPTSDNSQNDEGGGLINLTSTPGTHLLTDNGDGTITLTLGGTVADTFSYARNLGMVAPFNPNLTITLDSVIETTDTVSDTTPALPVTPSGLSIEQRFGRATLLNTFGPETQDQAMPLALEYYDGTTFLSNDLDINSSFDGLIPPGIPPASDLTCTIETGPITCAMVVVNDLGVLHHGIFTLPSPGITNTGVLTYSLDIFAKYPWLQFDWDNDGNHDNDPTATATFGIYRGNDRIINWREIVR